MDFTQKTYRTLLQALQAQGFSFITFEEYINNYKNKESVAVPDEAQNPQPATRNSEPPTLNPKPESRNSKPETQNSEPRTRNPERCVILRHDVDLKPQNSLATAKLEHELGIRGSYYFRAVPQSWEEQIIKEIASLGHEIGYHYETMDAVGGTQMTQIFRINADKYLKNIEHRISNTEYRTRNTEYRQPPKNVGLRDRHRTRNKKHETQNTERRTNKRSHRCCFQPICPKP